MDKNFNAKLASKKSQMAAEKTKKSASRKKKRSKKSSSKSDQSPELLEVEGTRAIDNTGAESDSSGAQARPTDSPIQPQKSSSVIDSSQTANKPTTSNDSGKHCCAESDSSGAQARPTDSPIQPQKSSSVIDSSQTANKSTTSNDLPASTPANTTGLEHKTDRGVLEQTVSSHTLNHKDSSAKKSSVSFSNFEEVQTISNTLSNMSVKSKNGSSKNKSKSSSKSSSNGAKREKTKAEPLKSCINKAAEAAAKLKSEESLRWEFALEDEEQEKERIHIYKINRRKRYLAAAQEKGLGWVQNYGNNGMPLLEEPPTDFKEPEVTHKSVTDFTPIRNIMASQSSEPLAMGGEIAC